ncbi:LamG domain-containing protein, partial [bacterium]|nr:LamG domain-containing protein [bacterium]
MNSRFSILFMFLSLIFTQDNSLSFDGENVYVMGNASSNLDVSSANRLTITSWVKPYHHAHGLIFQHTNDNGNGQSQYALQIDGDRVYFTTAGSATADGSFEGNGQIRSNNTIENNEWSHVVITYDGSAMRIYINGNEDFESYVTDTFSDVYVGEFYIGAFDNGILPFSGEISDISVLSTALSSEEVNELFNLGPTFDITEMPYSSGSLEGYWNFNEGSGDVLYDYSGNGNHGTIYGAEWTENDSDPDPNTHLVPDEYDTIQLAIDAASDGDTVYVSSGTYYETINFNGKNISVIGEDRENTIIDANQGPSVVEIANYYYSSPLLSGFTLQNGSRGGGGGIYIHGNHSDNDVYVQLENLIIRNNESTGGDNNGGGGIHIYKAHATMDNIIFEGNQTNGHGGAIYAIDSDSHIDMKNCVFKNNTAELDGGALYVNNSNINLDKCLINNNYCDHNGGAIYAIADARVEFIRSTLINNQSGWNTAFYLDCQNSYMHFNTSIVWDNDSWATGAGNCLENEGYEYYIDYSVSPGWNLGINNIFEDPQLNDDYSLQSSSLCIDSGDPAIESDPDETRADMGVYYFHQIPGCTDELACNPNSEATIDDDSCDYSCHDNGDYSLSFDGHEGDIDDEVVIDIPITLNNFEFSVDVKSNYLAEDVDQAIFSINPGYDYSALFFVTTQANKVVAQVRDETMFGAIHLESSQYSQNSNEWVNIKVSLLDGIFSLFLDNVLVAQETEVNILPITPSVPIRIGSMPYSGYTRSFHGLIDNISLINNEVQILDYKFNKGMGNNLIDHSGNQNHGTIYGAEWVEVENIEEVSGCTDEFACNYNSDATSDDDSCDYSCHDNGDYSLSFDGQDRIEIENSNSLNVDSNDFTITGWITTSDNEGMIIIKSEGGVQGNDWYQAYLTDGRLKFEITDEYNAGGDYASASTSIEINDNLRHFFGITFDRDGFGTIYIDGIERASTDISPWYGDINNNAPLNIGYYNQSEWTSLEAIIDDLSIWNYALNSSEINSLMNEGIQDSEDQILDYKFNKGTGNNLIDHSGNQNHGTIYGNAEWVEVENIEEVSGCTDELACNYNSDATNDDGSCDYDCHDNGDYSLSFDGQDDYVSSNLNTTLSSENGTWIGLISFDNTDQEHGVFAQNNGFNTNGFYINTASTDGDPNNRSTIVFSTANGNNQVDQSWTYPNAIEANKLHHIAISLINNEIKIYIDGQLSLDENTNHSIIFSDGQYLIGSGTTSNGDLTQFLNGKVNEVSYWNVGLNQDEVLYHMNNNEFLNEEGLLAYYKFNQGPYGDYPETLIDHSGNQNHGTINGAQWEENIEEVSGCTDELACNYNSDATADDDSCDYSCIDNGDYSLSFDGNDDYVFIGSPEILEFQSNNFTVSSWVKTGVSKRQWIMSNYLSYGEYPLWMYGIPNNSNPNCLGYDLRPGCGEVETEINIVDSNWHNVVLTRDGQTIKIFLDGIKIFENSYDLESLTTGNDYFIGTDNNQSLQTWDGYLDDIVIWDRTLSNSEIVDASNHIYESNGIVAHWPFDNGSGQTLYDISGYGNHGIINGAQWVENTEEISGCTDELACNYNSDATSDNGSCEYDSCEEYNFAGFAGFNQNYEVAVGPNFNCEYDNNLPNYANISSPEEACSMAFSIDEASPDYWEAIPCQNFGQWTMYECNVRDFITNQFYLGNATETSVDVLYSSAYDIGGFQFTIDGTQILGASGGIAEDIFGADGVQWSELGIVIGFSFDPNVFIPAGEGVLTTLSILPYNSPTDVCITDLVVSDTVGSSALDFDQGCLPLPCEDLDQDNICDFADDCVSNGGGNLTDGYDCGGVCNGLAFTDDCDICSEGDTDHVADSDKDCNGDCFGSAYWD